jgi:hypothetical protein
MSNDLRKYPRVITDVSVEVKNGEGLTLTAQLFNLSQGGGMLEGDEALKNHLVDVPGLHVTDVRTIEFELAGMLAEGGGRSFWVPCRLVHVRRLSQHQFHIGFMCRELETELRTLLDNYLEQMLRTGHF